MTKEILLGVVLVIALFFMIALTIYNQVESGFKDKQDKIQQVYEYFGNKLTYKELKKRCPECTNVDYYRVMGKL
jgi:p-aminobenzoyl-glutamate transporter AbgT